MIAKLTEEQIAGLNASFHGDLEVIDPMTQRRYFLVDAEIHQQAMEALRREEDKRSIAQGIAEMEAGLGLPVDEVFKKIRAKLGFRDPQN